MGSVGDRLKVARALVEGLSARELDRLAGLSEGHISLIESGDRPNPTRDTIEAIAAVFGSDVEARSAVAGWLSFGGKAPSARAVRSAVEAVRSKKSAA